jgi:hypothetical protein
LVIKPLARSQLPNNTDHTSGMDSLSQPGKSRHSTGTNRLRLSGAADGGASVTEGAGLAGMVGMLSTGGGKLLGAGAGVVNGTWLAHAAKQQGNSQRLTDRHIHAMGLRPKITVHAEQGNTHMLLILLEALGAGLILVAIVWWTMFSGRRKGERDADE